MLSPKAKDLINYSHVLQYIDGGERTSRHRHRHNLTSLRFMEPKTMKTQTTMRFHPQRTAAVHGVSLLRVSDRVLHRIAMHDARPHKKEG